MKRLALAGLLALPAALAATEVDFGFTRGETALDVRSPRAVLDAESCRGCHPDQHAAWARSRHAHAWTNAIFQEGFALEPLHYCVNCHAPLREQVAEIQPNMDWYRDRGPHGRADGVLRTRAPEPLAEQGVSCPACHVRDSAVIVKRAVEAEHPTSINPEWYAGELCRDCHEFDIHDADGRPSGVAMQSTWSEWEDWASSGGQGTCQGCHMPDGDHDVRGAHDQGWLRASVHVETAPSGTYAVWTEGVGHHLPSGDLFRHLTLEEERDGSWVTIGWIGRRFQVLEDAQGRPSKQLLSDTSLRPGERRVYQGQGGPWRLRYHYGSASDEAAGRIPLEDLVVTLHEG